MQVRKATVKKDGVELTRSFERYVLNPGKLDDSGNLVDTNVSGEPAEVSAICNAVWTADVKAAWKAKLEADKTVIGGEASQWQKCFKTASGGGSVSLQAPSSSSNDRVYSTT